AARAHLGGRGQAGEEVVGQAAVGLLDVVPEVPAGRLGAGGATGDGPHHLLDGGVRAQDVRERVLPHVCCTPPGPPPQYRFWVEAGFGSLRRVRPRNSRAMRICLFSLASPPLTLAWILMTLEPALSAA